MIAIAAKLQVPLTDCSGERSFLLFDSGEAELGEDEVESDSGVSGSELNVVTGLESVGKGDLESGGDGWLGTQMYQAKDALSRRTL